MDSNDLASQNKEIIYYLPGVYILPFWHACYCCYGTVDKYSYMHASNRIGSDLSLCDDNDKICIFVRYDNWPS